MSDYIRMSQGHQQLYLSGFYDQELPDSIRKGQYFKMNCGGSCDWAITKFVAETANNFSIPYDEQKHMYVFSFYSSDLMEQKETQLYQLMQDFSQGQAYRQSFNSHDWIYLTDQRLDNYDHDTEVLDVDYDEFGGCVHYSNLM